MATINCFIKSRHERDLTVVAVCECGEQLTEHISSSVSFAKHDIGIDSDWYHNVYLHHIIKSHSGEDYQLIWSDEPPSMLPAGLWPGLSTDQREAMRDTQDRIVRHINAEVEHFYTKHPGLRVNYRFQIKAEKR